ncbi:unnamed protein product [Zymoseptoria tritici ST99CH_1A5]|uniref:NDT80 domain-containing protein n=3 Tax=Zymoseptoria tritici TaxID=1047171 RepID=A0A1X7RJW6_ZYMT9|nr:unnamed protein product [Zymoseptoria tritici ST99CH_3D7]SMR46235.1 unnamed protein product [Zymoseptoria tritici ST99CH_1E4]SMR47485.1 unnamed protein product [Zymoseptoria tritici ST99CH_3D1]SMY21385.1 unnamed protein product [Zymoseptoria tritici ST99CH_1A5]
MDLSGFDPSTMTYLATQMQHPNAGGSQQDPFQEMLLPSEFADHHSTYGGYAASEDLNLHSLQQQPLKRFASAYEDPFSDVVSAFEAPAQNDAHDTETPSIDRDNKLLSFSPPTLDYTLLDYTYRRTTISLSAQLHGMFFLAESPWASAGDAQPPPSELTCYRRNLFQITGEITLPRTLRYIMTEQGEQIPIIGQELVISATESTEGNSVKIISVPWKTPTNPTSSVPEDKTEREPPSFPIDLINVQEMNTDFASFPFQWKRLQFRIATANNGRRKELQQHFVVKLKLLATLATGGKIPIASVQSGAIIVRGRSPRNFQSRKDMPLNGGGHARKTSNLPGRASSSSNEGPTATPKQQKTEAPTSNPIKTERHHAPSVSMASFYDPHESENFQQQQQTNALNWPPQQPADQQYSSQQHTTSGAQAPLTTPPTPYEQPRLNPNRPPSSTTMRPPPPAPVNLSLLEDETPTPSPLDPTTRSTTNPSSTSPPIVHTSKRSRLPPPVRPPSFSTRDAAGLHSINSPDESADLLYEYFPLGLDDWMPPVEAVYRPHVVHHTKLPLDPRVVDGGLGGGGYRAEERGNKGRSKRYFSEGVS